MFGVKCLVSSVEGYGVGSRVQGVDLEILDKRGVERCHFHLVQGFGFTIQGLGFTVYGSWFRVWGLGFRV